MRKHIATIIALFIGMSVLNAQNAKNSTPDSILGNYESEYSGQVYRVRVTKNPDGTYKAQNYYLKYPNGKDGKPLLDKKNPDKSLRNVPYSQVVLIEALQYDPDKKTWGNAKIYDPSRGLKANVTAVFLPDGRLKLRGSVLGIGETIYWVPVTEE